MINYLETLASTVIMISIIPFTQNASFKYTLFDFFSIAIDCVCRLKQVYLMYLYIYMRKLACHILMYEHKPFISSCVLPRACKSLFTRNGAEKRSGACIYTCIYASVELREACRCIRRTAPRQIGVVRRCVQFNANDKGKIRLRQKWFVTS